MPGDIGPAYLVETERLSMRCLGPDDAPAVRAALDRSDAYLRPWIPFMKDEPRSLAQTASWLGEHRARFDLGEYFRYGVFERQSGELVGENMLLDRVGPHAFEIGYLTYLGYEGRGYSNEATCAVIRLAFEIHGVDRVEIHCAPENEPSAAIPARLGFEHEATLKRRAWDTDGVVRDLMIWSLFADAFPGGPASQCPMRAWDALGSELVLSGGQHEA